MKNGGKYELLENYYNDYDEEGRLSCRHGQAEFLGGYLKEHMSKKMLTEDFHCISKPEDLFAMVRLEEIYELTAELGVERKKIIASDGATNYMREAVDAFDDETFALWMQYHLATCERSDLIGATNHSLDILEKK